MAFTPKDWKNATTHEGGGDTSTPISEAALEDLETRVTDYVDSTVLGERHFDVTAYGAVHDDTTDDTGAIQDAIDACITAGGGVVYFPAGIYKISGALVTSYGGHTYNSQLVIPDSSENSLTLRGPNPPPVTNDVPQGDDFAVLRSTIAGSGTSPSLLGGRTGSGVWTGTRVALENMVFRCPDNPTLSGVNLENLWAATVDDCVFDVGKDYLEGATEPTTPGAIGLIMPDQNNSSPADIGFAYVQGFWGGFKVGCHVTARDIHAHCCKVAVIPAYGQAYPPHIRRLSNWDCPYGIAYADATGLIDLPGLTQIVVDQYVSEDLPLTFGAWTDRVADVWDQASGGTGGLLQARVGFQAFGSNDVWPPLTQGYGINAHTFGVGDHDLVYVYQAAEFLNGWSHGHEADPGQGNYVSIWMDATGAVHLSGSIAGGTAGQPALDIPRPFQPHTYQRGYYNALSYSGTAWEIEPVKIDTQITGWADHSYLNGISWLSSDRIVTGGVIAESPPGA